jgi:signal transduction histidine kinase
MTSEMLKWIRLLMPRRTRIALLGAMMLSCPRLLAAEPKPEPLSQIIQLQRLVDSPVKHLVDVRLTATVLGIDSVHHGLAIQDRTGILWLDGGPLPKDLEPGSRVSIEGKALIGDRRAILGFAPLIDQDRDARGGIGSCRVYLDAGKHRFDLLFVQEGGLKSLSVILEGPGLARTNVPDSMLWHSRQEMPGVWLPGLEYACYEGSWPQIPDFGTLTPTVSGIATNFDLNVASRETNFGLRFSGWLQVTEAGHYEFETRADDSGRLVLPYDPGTDIKVIGRSNLPQPHRLVPGQLWNDLEEPCWAEVEGVVRHVGVFEGRLQLELAVESGRMQVTVADGHPLSASILLNSRVRLTGLCRSASSPGGARTAGLMQVPNMDCVTVLQASEVTWLAHPVCLISNLSDIYATGGSASILRIQGTVLDVTPGRSLIVADSTGRIEAYTRQARSDDKGKSIELLGQLTASNRLDYAAYREGTRSEPSSQIRSTLTTIEQIRRLAPDAVTRSHPVLFQGVVTFVFYSGLRAHVQGQREGIYVSCQNNNPQPLKVGDLCEFEGYSSPGAFSPVVTYRRRTILGRGQLPEPLRPDWSQLANGSLDSQWVEVQGVVLQINGSDLVLGMRGGGEITAHVFEGDDSEIAGFLGAVVRVRGTVRGFSNAQRQVQRVLIQVISPALVTVDEASPADPFAMPSRAVVELFLFDPNAASLRRVKTAGQIVHVRDGIGYLMDGTNGMRFAPRATEKFVSGDWVEVVGFPETEGLSPIMRQSLVRVVGHSKLPAPQALSSEDLLNRMHDSTLVEVRATLLNIRTNQSDYLLELQAGSHSFVARLNQKIGSLPIAPAGSRVRIAGLYSTHDAAAGRSNNLQGFELFLNSPADFTVLQTPSWWNLRNSLMVLGVMTLVLALSVIWITALRQRVDLRTRELRDEIEVRKRTETDLGEKTKELQSEIRERIQLHSELDDQKTRLEKEIEERKRMELEIEQVHRQLMNASRQAGQAEVASSVLHNVGNVLNSVNVSSTLIADRLRDWRGTSLIKAADLLKKRAPEMASVLDKNDPFHQMPAYLEKLAGHLDKERSNLLTEVKDLVQNIEHIKEIVTMQQAYAKVSGLLEKVAPEELVESAVKMHIGAYVRHSVGLVREFEKVPDMIVDRHKVLQILVNLLHNAKYACDEGRNTEKRVTIRIKPDGNERLVIQVSDNGIGIAPENMKRLFIHGFTTRKNGHGFGLHSAAIAAKELGGRLHAHSDGAGCGATFTLEMPLSQGERKSKTGDTVRILQSEVETR